MTEHHVPVGFRLRLFTLAAELGNVSAACRARRCCENSGLVRARAAAEGSQRGRRVAWDAAALFRDAWLPGRRRRPRQQLRSCRLVTASACHELEADRGMVYRRGDALSRMAMSIAASASWWVRPWIETK